MSTHLTCRTTHCIQNRLAGAVRRPARMATMLGLMMMLSHPTSLLAQQPLPVRPGTEVRIYSSTFNRVAIVARADTDTLRVITKERRDSVAVPTHSIRRLEQRLKVGLGKRALLGAKWGAMGGVGFGLMGIVMSERGPGDPPQAWWPLIGGATGAVLGTLLFVAVPEYRWEAVPLPEGTSISWRGTTRALHGPAELILQLVINSPQSASHHHDTIFIRAERGIVCCRVAPEEPHIPSGNVGRRSE